MRSPDELPRIDFVAATPPKGCTKKCCQIVIGMWPCSPSKWDCGRGRSLVVNGGPDVSQ